MERDSQFLGKHPALTLMTPSVFSDASDSIVRSVAGNMSSSRRPSIYKAAPDVWRREVGALSARKFAGRLGASEDLLFRFKIVKSLQMHLGCVNTVSFSSDGDTLLSGSDDKMVTLWDWQTGKVKFSFHSGHTNNVFQAKFMPLSENRSIITSAADCQVRHAQILDSGEVATLLLAKHEGRVHKLAIEPGSPHVFYTCGEDGRVKHFDLRMKDARRLFTCRRTTSSKIRGKLVPLNSIAIDPRNPNLFAVGGSDQYARLYDLRSYNWDASTDTGRPANYFCHPQLIDSYKGFGITAVAFSEQSELLVSYFDESIYLFDWRMGLGPDHVTESVKNSEGTEISVLPEVYTGHRNSATVKGVGFFGPNCEYVVSGSDCGRIFIWKKKGGNLVRSMKADKHVVNCIQAHPYSAVFASSGIETDVKIWAPSADAEDTLRTNIEEILGHGNENVWFSDNDEDYSFEGSLDDDDDDEDEDDEDDDDDDDSDDGDGADDIDGDFDDDDDDSDDADFDGNEDDDDCTDDSAYSDENEEEDDIAYRGGVVDFDVDYGEAFSNHDHSNSDQNISEGDSQS